MTKQDILDLFSLSGVKKKYIYRAMKFFERTSAGKEHFYNGEKKAFREEHISFEILKNYLKIPADDHLAQLILNLGRESEKIDPRIRGDFHIHTEFSDGIDTAETLIRRAKSLGYNWIALSDHAPVINNPYTLTVDKFFKRTEIAEQLSARSGIKVYHSIEANILEDGSVGIPSEVRDTLHFAMASLHHLNRDSEDSLLRRIQTIPPCFDVNLSSSM